MDLVLADDPISGPHPPGAHMASRWSVAGPIACGCALAAAAVYVASVDPMSPGAHLPACPLYEMTGFWCPGCGLTRAAHAFLRGHVGAAFGYNLFFPVFLGAIVIGWFAWLRSTLHRTPLRWVTRIPASAPIAFGVLLVAYGVLRNVPALHALAP